MLKVNWDVAIAQGENRMGVGNIIRDEKGNVIVATSKPVMDEMLGIVKVLRQKFPIHDRLMKMEVKKWLLREREEEKNTEGKKGERKKKKQRLRREKRREKLKRKKDER
jgi:hypothetical protein